MCFCIRIFIDQCDSLPKSNSIHRFRWLACCFSLTRSEILYSLLSANITGYRRQDVLLACATQGKTHHSPAIVPRGEYQESDFVCGIVCTPERHSICVHDHGFILGTEHHAFTVVGRKVVRNDLGGHNEGTTRLCSLLRAPPLILGEALTRLDL
jgi:hypothetical protein